MMGSHEERGEKEENAQLNLNYHIAKLQSRFHITPKRKLSPWLAAASLER